MIGVAVAKQTTASRRRFKEHSVASRIGRTIGDAMLHHVYIEAGPQGTHASQFLRRLCEFHNLFDREISTLGVALMEHECGNPNLVGHFEGWLRIQFRDCCPHKELLRFSTSIESLECRRNAFTTPAK